MKDPLKVEKLSLVSSLTWSIESLNRDIPSKEYVYSSNPSKNSKYSIYSEAFDNTFNRKPINLRDLISFEILRTLNALKILTDLKTLNDDFPDWFVSSISINDIATIIESKEFILSLKYPTIP